MAKKQTPLKSTPSKTTTVSVGKGRVLSNKDGNFTVNQNGKKTKPTSADTIMYNSAAKSSNKAEKKFNRPLLSDTLKKKKI